MNKLFAGSWRLSLTLLLFAVAIQLFVAAPVAATERRSLAISINVSPSTLALGEEVTLVALVSNESDRALTDVRLDLPSHPDVLYVSAPGLSRDRATQATLKIGNLAAGASTQVDVALRIRGLSRDGVAWLPFEARSVESEPVLERVQLAIRRPSPEQRPVAVDGSRIQLNDGRLTLDFPRNWHSQEAVLAFQLQEKRRLVSGEVGTFIAFEMEAIDDRGAVDDFSAPVVVTVQIADLIDLTETPSDSLKFYTREDETLPWGELPVNIDTRAGAIQFQAEHFSQFLGGTTAPDRWSLEYAPPSTSSFSGAATYGYAIPLPPGRGGLTPSLGLYYSSRGVDRSQVPAMSQGFGAGWSSGQMEIVNTDAGDWFDDDGGTGWDACPSPYFYPEHFTLSLNGALYHLSPYDGVSRHGRYYALGDPSIFVEYKNDGPDNVTGEYWLVRTADGTEYRFGYTEDAEHVIAPLKEDCAANNGQPRNDDKFAAHSWKLDTITDVYNREIRYIYGTRCGLGSGGDCKRYSTYDDQGASMTIPESDYLAIEPPGSQPSGKFRREIDVALATIEYNFDASVAQTVVDFDYGIKNYQPSETAEYMVVGFFRPTRVMIKHEGNMVSAYEFTYGGGSHWIPPSYAIYTHFWWVESITPYGSDYQESGGGTALPSMTFYYGPNTKSSCQDGNCVKLLERVSNDYGADTKFLYERWDSDGDPDTSGLWWTVADIYTWDGVRSVYDGVTSSASSRVEYDRSGKTPCYNEDHSDPDLVCRPPGTDETKSMVGFDGVTVTAHEPNGSGGWSALRETEHAFYHSANAASSYWIIGKTKKIAVNDPATGKTLSEHEEEWLWKDWVKFSRLESVKDLIYDPDSGDSLGVKQVYKYDLNLEGGRQWGRRTETSYFEIIDGQPTVTPYRTVRSKYVDNENTWLVVPYEQTVHEQDAAAPVQVELFLYDGEGDPDGQSVSLGQLDWKLSLVVPDGAPAREWNGVATSYDYYSSGLKDGLPQKSTQYDEYATLSVSADYEWGTVSLPAASEWRREVEVDYTPSALTPAWLKEKGNRITDVQQTDYTYDPVFFWLPASITDPNGVTKIYEYDPFGRLFAVYENETDRGVTTDPWDGNPLKRYRYKDNTWNSSTLYLPGVTGKTFHIAEQTYPNHYTNPNVDPNSPGYEIKTLLYYDGLGRLIQEHTPWAEVAGESNRRDIIVTTEYDALGQVACVTAPFDVPIYSTRVGWPNDGLVTDSCATHGPTTYEYDVLGRTTLITTPDGNNSQYNYSVVSGPPSSGYDKVRQEQVVDAEGHAIQRLYNPQGELIQVQEFEGIHPNLAIYATTSYTYTVSGQLEAVSDEMGNLSEMTYDSLGRKVTMDDPDMGHWEYKYDLGGNLSRQEDAKDEVVCFYYDGLDRLVRKAEDETPADKACPSAGSEPTTGPLHLASYEYDTAANGIGRLAEVSWGPDPDDNKDRFAYDDQGRVISQTRTVDGQDFTMLTLSFDLLHRPLEVQYPTGEVITNTYDREGPNALTADIDPLVSDVVYNERGQVVSLARGNGVATSNSYYGASGNFRLQETQNGTAVDLLPDFSYIYDSVGNITQLETATWEGTDTEFFSYDHLNRLTGAAGSWPTSYSHAYSYDATGNMTGQIKDGTIVAYDYTDPGPVPHPHGVNELTVGGSPAASFTYDDNGNLTAIDDHDNVATEQVIGEVGQMTAVDHTTSTGIFGQNYQNPVVIAQPPSFEGHAATVARITNISADHFAVYCHEAPNQDGIHALETLSWVVLEVGQWELADGTKIEVGKLSTDKMVGTNIADRWESVTFASDFSGAPVILSQVQTNNNPSWVKTRQQNASAGGFDVALEEDEASSDEHGVETIGWIAIEPGQGTWSGHKVEAGKTGSVVTHDWHQVTFNQSFAQAPRLMASMATWAGQNEAGLRYDKSSLTSSGFQIFVEEDTTADSEKDHAAEDVHFLAIEGGGTLTVTIPYSGTDPVDLQDSILDYDVENRLVTVTVGSEATSFTYDASGQRVKTAEPDGTIIYTPYPNYEVEVISGTVVLTRSLYAIGGQVIALRVESNPADNDDGLYYFHTDHLGSTSLLTDGNGDKKGDPIRYYPFGEYRAAPTTELTDRGFTGHRHNNLPSNDLGLIYMNARYYVSYINRFLTPDTIVPDPTNPQSYNRYSYVNNNPVRLRDPSGHCLIESSGIGGECTHSPPPQPPHGTQSLNFTASRYLQDFLSEAGIEQQSFRIRVHVDNGPQNPELYHYEIGAWILTQEHESFHPLNHAGNPGNDSHFTDIGLYTALVLLQVIDSRETNYLDSEYDFYRWIQENPSSGQVAYPANNAMTAPSDVVFVDFLIIAFLNDQGALPDTLAVYADSPTTANPSGRPIFYGHWDLNESVGAYMGRDSLSVSSQYWNATDWIPSVNDWLTVTQQ